MRRIFAALLSVFMVTGLLAVSPASAVGGTTNLSVLHGVPGLTVDVYVDGVLTIDDFAPETVAGPLTVASGVHQVAVTASDAADDSDPILEGQVELVAGADMTAAAHLDATGAPTLSIFNNDTSATESGEGRITVRHLADAPAVDVLAGGAVAFAELTSGNSASADLASGTVPVSLNAAGTSTQVFPETGTIDVALSAGANLVVYAVGDFDGSTFALVTQSIDPSTIGAPTKLTVVHGVPDVSVDVYVNGVLLLEDFEPGTVTPPVLVPAGTYDIEVFPADAAYVEGGGVIFVDDAIVPPGADISVAAHLNEAGTPIATIFVNDTSTIDSGEARLVVRHTAAAPTVDVLTTGPTKLVDSLSNPDEQQLDVDAGTYPVTVNAEDDPSPAVDLGDVTLVEGASTIVYAYGDLAADTFAVAVQAIPGLAEVGAFPDAGGRFYEDDVRTILQLGITTGTSPTTYSPEECVTRGQMSAFLVRTLGLPASDVDSFTDDDGTRFEDDINAIAAAGITTGVAPGVYAPDQCVTRGQMALFLVRAFSVPASGVDAFADDDGHFAEEGINALKAAWITTGTSPTTYSPDEDVTRGQMASFLARSIGLGSLLR